MEQIRVENISYSYQNQYQKIEAVKEVSCVFETGKLYAVVGESGSGKSTFLSLLAENRRRLFIRRFIYFRF